MRPSDGHRAQTMKNLLLALAACGTFASASALAETTPPAPVPLAGEVLEVLDGGAFTYLRLKTADGETWAAVKRAAIAPGARVVLDDPLPMQNFESKALQRRFDVLVFGTLADAAGRATPVAPASPALPGPQTPRTAKAEGPDARTVAEIHAERLALKDHPVVVRAKVVKVNAGVMGRNWIHLRDGSGSPADGSDDVVATSSEEPNVGDVVVAKGTVRTDLDFGSGYAYRVLVEDAKFLR
jgi:hypothetical protein